MCLPGGQWPLYLYVFEEMRIERVRILPWEDKKEGRFFNSPMGELREIFKARKEFIRGRQNTGFHFAKTRQFVMFASKLSDG